MVTVYVCLLFGWTSDGTSPSSVYLIRIFRINDEISSRMYDTEHFMIALNYAINSSVYSGLYQHCLSF